MRTQYIAISPDTWGKGQTAKGALANADINQFHYDVSTVLEVTYPDNETDADDITFHWDGSYELKGKTTAVAHKGEAAIDALLGGTK